ncbi:hypothetical protein Hypma_013384 [Hypsizygus marmoreus]|uniref:Protein rds1 n=1 Tax=Hypsizygus marmoreus TaxID=39966 RepID=A0A369JJG5_HYPMA|nr:hypothetical protein Hypma_013384 [Hypsizygus marmoreus]
MRYSSALFALAAPLLASAAPARFYGKRAATDILVFKFADVLEQLESAFYQQAIAKFTDADFTNAGFPSSQIAVEQFKSIQADEATHSVVLQAALKSFGEAPITGCQFNFDAALADVATMAATARVVENVGVTAYLGGAALLTDPVLITAAGAILTVEARHQTILNVLSSTGTAIPSAFDFAFTPSEVLAIAAPFITGGCDIPIPANTPLSLTNTGTVAPGTLLTFKASSLNGTIAEDTLFCQMLIGGAPTSIPLPLSQCVVPEINGPVALFITSDGQPLLNNVRDRAQNKVIAGPALAFIDTKPQMLSQLLRSGAASSGSGSGSGAEASTSTRTISPAEASSVIASASGTAESASATAAPSSGNATSSGSATSGPNTFTGKSADGKITVNGWTNV